jgi:uroporphyrinogen decarboxylase
MTIATQEHLILNALACENQSRPPVWMMRQAGRCMPAFREYRKKYDFMTLCKTPELAAAVTKLPIDGFGMDAAILFSDILVIADALNRGLHFEAQIGPVIDKPIRNTQDLKNVDRPCIKESLSYVGDAIRCVKPQLDVPIFGFCGAPFTVASYLIEGGSSKSLKNTKLWMLNDPEGFHALLELICEYTIEYLLLQVEAGADALQIFDTWAIHLAHPQFLEFSLAYMEKIVEALRPTGVPLILYCRGSSVFAEELASLRPAAISLDWNVSMAKLARTLPKNLALQGNLDPDILYSSKDVIEKETRRLLTEMKDHPGYIFNLGHGLKPDIPEDAVRIVVNCIKNFNP